MIMMITTMITIKTLPHFEPLGSLTRTTISALTAIDHFNIFVCDYDTTASALAILECTANIATLCHQNVLFGSTLSYLSDDDYLHTLLNILFAYAFNDVPDWRQQQWPEQAASRFVTFYYRRLPGITNQ